ncbi:DUF58 domain-containing protein [Candidatus Woesearchaeota archaeon CG10_big_fil_rev_8_21_14_0_10_44_13]|nr:MAG: DUF58 domain-containing protein [Candidatus Woesearchaeota archaeon CG10_big_fil_rev_8_21_14_0_10_44_13]
MIDTTFLDQLKRFSLIINKRVTSSYSGEKKSVAEGRGLIFKDHRMYARGDDIRLIDWKVFARTDDLYVKRYEEERNLSVHILIDGSASMNYGKGLKKFDYASMIGVGFAYLALRDNEKFQFCTFSDSLELFKPKRGMNQLAGMVMHLNNTKKEGNSKIYEAVAKYKKVIGSRSLIILISDFLINIDEIKAALYRLGDHEIKVIQVLDPVESDLTLEGDLKLMDSETKELLKTHISPRLRMEYQSKLNRHMNEISDTCNKLGIDFYSITTNTPIFDAFYKILR